MEDTKRVKGGTFITIYNYHQLSFMIIYKILVLHRYSSLSKGNLLV
jgi:hypothetical protein